MLSFILWYLLITILGWLTFPLAYRLLPGLPGRGYAFSRTLGWLLWGFAFWLPASLGILRNDASGWLFALLAVLTLSVWALRGLQRGEIRAWLRAQRGLVLGVEILFFVAFAGWAAVRAANPEIYGTEKPMELAFINAILRSPVFPPHDPWLSGYAISYYHFGYILVAMLAGLTGVPGSVSFNLGISLVFALSTLGAYGMVYDLLSARTTAETTADDRPPTAAEDGGQNAPHVSRFTFSALLGPLFVLLVSNIEGVLEVLHARGIGSAAFWRWLDIPDINQPPVPPFTWVPRLYGTGSWWWWRASRVVQDYDLAGNLKEIIDEFPFFSYLLADLHPHVLAMPFAFLSMALALNLFLGGAEGRLEAFRQRVSARGLGWAAVLLLLVGAALLWAGARGLNLRLGLLGILGFGAGGVALARIQPAFRGERLESSARKDRGEIEVGMAFSLSPAFFLLSAVVLGGLAFLNTWDFPFYVALFAGAYALKRTKDEGRMTDSVLRPVVLNASSFVLLLKDFLGLSVAVGITGILLYLPFYLGFSSQAGGILPNLVFPTRGAHRWVMFAPFLFPLAAYLMYLWKAGWPEGDPKPESSLKKGFALAAGLALALWALSLLLGLIIISLPAVGDIFMAGVLGSNGRAALFQEIFTRRLSSSGGWITLVVLLGLTLGLFLREGSKGLGERGIEEEGIEPLQAGSGSPLPLRSPAPLLPRAHTFALLLILLGALLVLFPEFFYLRDQFGWRINTIFKFYYQAWLLWGVAAAYGAAVLLKELKRPWSMLFSLGMVLVLGMGLVYTVFGLWDKTRGFNPPEGWTLDGAAHIERRNPDEMAAVRWLRSVAPGVVVEAVGGSYSEYARISMLSGQPSLLGWPGHEVQWRGGGIEMGTRQADIERIYCSRDWVEAMSLLQRYHVRYVYIGALERTTYTPGTGSCTAGLNEAKFLRALDPVFKQGEVAIYEVPE